MSDGLVDTAGRVETPEHIAFEFRLAGPWRRMVAYAIDVFVRSVVLAVAAVLLTVTSLASGLEELFAANGALLTLAYFGIEWFYMVIFEWLWNGQTPGKRTLGLRVLKEGGFPIGLQDALLRNLLRAADLFPPLTPLFGIPAPSYLVGMLVAASDAKFRRLGDLVAGTIVVVEEPVRLRRPAPVDPPPTAAELALVPVAPRLSVEEKRTLDAFLRRFRLIHPARREELCEPWARALAARYGAPEQQSWARYLQLVYARLTERSASSRKGPP